MVDFTHIVKEMNGSNIMLTAVRHTSSFTCRKSLITALKIN